MQEGRYHLKDKLVVHPSRQNAMEKRYPVPVSDVMEVMYRDLKNKESPVDSRSGPVHTIHVAGVCTVHATVIHQLTGIHVQRERNKQYFM